MKGFFISTKNNVVIRFSYYTDMAPVTVMAFDQQLPFSRVFIHARVSGQEFWTDNAPALNIIQENASVFTLPGEVVIGPLQPARTKTSGCMGIYYGEGKGLDCCNIFARVFDEDMLLLQALGASIWKQGEHELYFKKMD
ncbi:DUF3830 family protein [Ferruginibacter profundus]